MNHPRKNASNSGSLGTPKNIRPNARPYFLTPKGIDFVLDHKAKLGAIAADENLPRANCEVCNRPCLVAYMEDSVCPACVKLMQAEFPDTPKADSHVSLVNDAIVEMELSQATPQRQKIDAIIAEIRAPKPAPTQCWDCGCTSIEIHTFGKNPPAYICALCMLWLGDVNPEINIKFELISKLESLLWDLARIPLSDNAKFTETLETVQLIRAEILDMESK